MQYCFTRPVYSSHSHATFKHVVSYTIGRDNVYQAQTLLNVKAAFESRKGRRLYDKPTEQFTLDAQIALGPHTLPDNAWPGVKSVCVSGMAAQVTKLLFFEPTI
jgi:hypothetical protein